MPKLVVWTFALCTVLVPWGRAHAKPRVEPSIGRTSPRSVEDGAADKPEPSKAEPSKDAAQEQLPATTAKKLQEPRKRAAGEALSKLSKKTKRQAKVKQPCFSPEVHLARRRGDLLEHRDLALTFCDGAPNPAALDSVSVLARPRDAERPLLPEIRAYQRRPLDRGPTVKRRRPEYLTEHVLRVHADLLTRLQKVALRFAGKTIEVVSGHRPDARDTSRHHHGRALDIRVDGVSREALRDFLRTIDDTGVGYYPNSYFVHMDVRDKRGYWVDRSGPGEAADYGTWPPSRDDVEQATDRVLASALRDLAMLGVRDERETNSHTPSPAAAEAHDEPVEDALTRDEVARIRAEALDAIEAL